MSFSRFFSFGPDKNSCVFLFETVGANTSYVLCVVTHSFVVHVWGLYEMVRTPRRYSLKMAGFVYGRNIFKGNQKRHQERSKIMSHIEFVVKVGGLL